MKLVSERGELIETGVIDRTVEFVHRNMGSVAWLDGACRVKKTSYPTDAIREAVVNAVVHRDYARSDTEIEVSLYDDRLEIISPGKLPNRVTVEKMREGVVRAARNEMLKEICATMATLSFAVWECASNYRINAKHTAQINLKKLRKVVVRFVKTNENCNSTTQPRIIGIGRFPQSACGAFGLNSRFFDFPLLLKNR